MSLINREDLIAEYDRVHVGPPGGARKLMVDAPEVKPEPKWIPFDEQQPEYRQEILVTIHCHESGEEEYFVQFDTYFDDVTLNSNFEIGRDAFAWMPLPEPYREEGENR